MPDIVLINNYNIGEGNNSYVDFVAELLNATEPVNVSPLKVTFAPTKLGSKENQMVILTNNQSKPLPISSIAIEGTDGSTSAPRPIARLRARLAGTARSR